MRHHQPMTECPFSVGDLVVLKTGKKTQRVVQVVPSRNSAPSGWRLHTRYLGTPESFALSHPKWRSADDYIKFNQKEPEEMTQKLYEILNKETLPAESRLTSPLYGTQIGTDSAGRAVLEIKGTGEVHPFDKSQIREVLPYTVRLKAITNGASDKRYITKEGSVAKGDLVVLRSGALYLVAQVDTRDAGVTDHLRGRRIPTEELAVSDAADPEQDTAADA